MMARFDPDYVSLIAHEVEELPDALYASRAPLNLQAAAIALRSRLSAVTAIAGKEMTAAEMLPWRAEADSIELEWIDLKHRAEPHLQEGTGPMSV